MIKTWNQRHLIRINPVQNRDQFGSPQTLISAKKQFISVKMPSSCYGTPLSQLWNCNMAQLWNTWRVKSYVFHWWHTNLGSMAQLWNTQKSLFHSRNTIFWQTPAMETVKFLTKKLRKHSNFLGFFLFPFALSYL